MTDNLPLLIPFGFSALLFVIFAGLYFRWSKAKNSWKKVTATIIQIREEDVSIENARAKVDIYTLQYQFEGNNYTSELSEQVGVLVKEKTQGKEIGDSIQVFADPQNPQKTMVGVSGCGLFFVKGGLIFSATLSLLFLVPFFIANEKNSYPTETKKAVQSGGYEAVVQFWTAGGDINIRDERGETLLMIAAFHKDERICKMLLIAGALVNVKSVSGETALDMATFAEDPDIVALLREYGAKKGEEL